METKMNLTDLFSVVLVFLYCNVGIGCLEISLDGFMLECRNRTPCNASAFESYYLTGTIVLNVGEELPTYISCEEICPPAKECFTRRGTGSWTPIRGWWSRPTSSCHGNGTHWYSCHLLSERKYGFYIYVDMFYTTKLCTHRVRLCDETFEVCGPASNELKASDIRTDSRYGYDTVHDEFLETRAKECWEDLKKHHLAAHGGTEEKRHASDDFLMIFGVVLAISMIDFF